MKSFTVIAFMANLAFALPEDQKPRRVSYDAPCRVKNEIVEDLIKTPLIPVNELPV